MVNLRTSRWEIEDVDWVIFDKDGTFIDIHTYWGRVVELRARKVINYFNLTPNFFKPLCDVMGYDTQTKKLPSDSPVGLYARDKVEEILLYYLISKDIEASLEDIEQIFSEVGQEFLSEQGVYTTLIPESVVLMSRLKEAGAKMIVITSDSQKNAIQTVKSINNGILEGYFENVYGAENSPKPKTTGDIVKTALKELGADPNKTICIGDTPDDYLMAKNSGIKACVNVSTGVVTTAQLQEFNDYTVSQLDEIEVY